MLVQIIFCQEFKSLYIFPSYLLLTFHCWCERDVFSTIDVEDLDIDDPPIQTYFLKDEYLMDDSLLFGDYDEKEALTRGLKNTNCSLSSYIFGLILSYSDYCQKAGGSLSISIEDNEQFLSMMDDFFDRKTIIDSQIVYEKQNIISVVNHVEDPKCLEYSYRLFLSLWKPLDRKEIPDFIVQYIGGGGSYSGLFSDILDERRENIKQRNSTKLINLVDDRHLKEQDDNWDEIPF